MHREYGSEQNPEEDLGIKIEPFNPDAEQRTENVSENYFSSPEHLKKLGIHPHFAELEIETKLEIRHEDKNPERIMKEVKKILEKAGCTFIGDMEKRENYVIYYAKDNGQKVKAIVRNRGASGIQVKQKSERLEGRHENILIRNETKSPIFKTLTEAEQYLTHHSHIQDPRHHQESIIRRKMAKWTLSSAGKDSVIRYFRILADEISLADEPEHQEKSHQIELEYKGTDSDEQDNLTSIQEHMEEIISSIQQADTLDTKRTVRSKRSWAQKQREEIKRKQLLNEYE